MSNIVKECFVTARDGVKLYTVIQLPCEQGTFPTIIIRNPYAPDKIDFEALANENTHGYAIVSQHCRGTAKSEGVCIPYLNERNDGLDLLDWVRQQSFYNGELFLLGGEAFLVIRSYSPLLGCIIFPPFVRYSMLFFPVPENLYLRIA